MPLRTIVWAMIGDRFVVPLFEHPCFFRYDPYVFEYSTKQVVKSHVGVIQEVHVHFTFDACLRSHLAQVLWLNCVRITVANHSLGGRCLASPPWSHERNVERLATAHTLTVKGHRHRHTTRLLPLSEL